MIFDTVVPWVNMHKLTVLDFRCDVLLSKWRPWRHFAKPRRWRCVGLQCEIQYLIYGTFVLVRPGTDLTSLLILFLFLLGQSLKKAQGSVISNRVGRKFGGIVPQEMCINSRSQISDVFLLLWWQPFHTFTKPKALSFQIGSGWNLAGMSFI